MPHKKATTQKVNKNVGLFSNKLITKSLREKSIELYVHSKTEALMAYCDGSLANPEKMRHKQRKMISGLKLRPLSLSATKYGYD